MGSKAHLHELIDTLTEEEASAAERLILSLKSSDPFHPGFQEETPKKLTPNELFDEIGPWEDERTTEEIIRDIYESRTTSDRDITL